MSAEPHRVRAAEAELSRCVIQLVVREPFFGHLLGGVARIVGDEVPTLAVRLVPGGVALAVNPGFFLDALPSRPQRVAVLKHEALHVVFEHLLRPRHAQPRLHDLACELVVNQYIGPLWELPDSAVTLASFPELELPPERSAEWYYERLLEAGVGGDAGAGAHSDHSGWGEEPPGADDEADGATAGGGGEGSPESPADAGMDRVTRQAARGGVSRLVKRARDRAGERTVGDLPQGVREALSRHASAGGSRVEWRRALRIFAASGGRTRLHATTRRESRRFGTIPGIKIKRHHRLAVAVDTSGSVRASDLARIFDEVHEIWRTGATVDVFECDAALQRAWTYRGDPPEAVEGRGGTAFDPVFAHLRDAWRERWDGCIYITDGHGPRPTVRPPCKVLWLVTRGGTSANLDFGRVLFLDPP